MTGIVTPGSSGRIVVSHAPEDATLAASICTGLEERQVRCWLPSRDAPAGSAGVDAHAAALEDATAVLVLVSEAANESAEVRREFEAAVSARRPLLALSLGRALPDGHLRYYLGESHRFELGGDQEVVLDELADALRRFLRVEDLPRPATALVGRRRELAQVVELLHDPDTRLLSLTGPGGTGKTRLALEVARSLVPLLEDGAVWVSLAPLRDPGLALSTIAQALAVEEQPGTELLDTLADALAGRDLLLVLDNAEHLLPELSADVAALAACCPDLRFLVTTRERLNIQGERVYAVPGLQADEAIELFLARARTLGVRLERSTALAELCERLDRLPLALELAAARSSLFTPEQLLDRLAERLDLLKGARDADLRQQTLRATIDWSYDLLAEDERRIFRSLSVFAGGCTYEAAEAVAGATADLLQSLIDKSLLRTRDTPLGRRYWMLETIREYAAARLDGPTDERDELLERHCQHFAGLLELVGPQVEAADDRRIAAVADEVLDLRAALEWAARPGDPLRLARMVWHLGTLWNRLGLGVEAGSWAERALALIDDTPREERAACLSLLGIAAWRRGEHERATDAYLESANIWRLLDNKGQLAALLGNLGWVAVERGDDEQAARRFEEAAAVAREAGNEREELAALGYLGTVHIRCGDSDQAVDVLQQVAAKAARIRADDRQAWALSNLGMAHALRGEYQQARLALAEALDLLHRLGWIEGIVYTLAALADVASATGDPVRAVHLLGAAEQLGESIDLRWQIDDARQREATKERVRAALGAEYERAVAAAALVSIETVIAEESLRSGESAKGARLTRPDELERVARS